jgi:hypothetical protein
MRRGSERGATIRLELDPPSPIVVAAGDSISGRLHVSAPQRLRIHHVELAVGWRTAGRGETDAHVAYSERILRGPWLEGEFDTPFAVRLPDAPFTYNGRIVKIRWAVRATIDRVLASNVVEELPIRVA